ncbi:MAG: hypothetical protein AAGI12_13220 [Pseudomonadota bacterium]
MNDAMNHLRQYSASAPAERLSPLWNALVQVLAGPWLTRVVIAFTGIILIAVVAMTILRPSMNWDALPYLALAQETPGDDAVALHRRAFDTVKSLAGPSEFAALTGENDYRIRQFEDSAAFNSMLPMYRVKAGYVAALRGLQPWLTAHQAAQTINLAALAVLAFVCLWWLRQGGNLWATPLVAWIFLTLQGREMIGGVAPDLAAAALTVAALAAFTARKTVPTVVALTLAMTVRPDTVLLAIAMMLASLMFAERRAQALLGLVVCLAAYFVLTRTMGHIGWWPHFWFSNIQPQETMAGFDPEFSWLAYAKGVARGSLTAFAYFQWPLLLALGLGSLLMLAKLGTRIATHEAMTLTAIILTLGAKFVLFPLPDDRIYMPLVLAFALVLIGLSKQIVPKPVA